jgi:spore coat protein U-like protein
MVKRIILIVAIAMIAFSGLALAADTNTVTVTANVVGTCKFTSATSTLAFGALDPSSAADGTAIATTTFWCTRNASYSIGDNDGLHESGPNLNRMQNTLDAAEYIPYSFSYNPASGSGNGPAAPITLTMNGLINNADYVNAASGAYSDTVVLSITP